MQPSTAPSPHTRHKKPEALERVTRELQSLCGFMREGLSRGIVDRASYEEIMSAAERALTNYTRRQTPQEHLFLPTELLQRSEAAREAQRYLDTIYLNNNKAEAKEITDPKDPDLKAAWGLFEGYFDPGEMDDISVPREEIAETAAGEAECPFVMQVIKVPGPKGKQVASAISGNLMTAADRNEEFGFGTIAYLMTKDDMHDLEGDTKVTSLRKNRQFGTALAAKFDEKCRRLARGQRKPYLGTLLEARSGSERFWVDKYGAGYACIRTPDGSVQKVPYFAPSLKEDNPEPCPETLAFKPASSKTKELPKAKFLAMVKALFDAWYMEDGVDAEQIWADFQRAVEEAPGDTVLLLNDAELAQMQTRGAIERTAAPDSN